VSAERINPPELSPPTGFSHAVVATGATLPEQFEKAHTNLLTALAATGGTPADLARVTVYATDIAAYRTHAPELGGIWRELAGRDYPAMAVVEVVRLWDDQALVELDGFAVLA
jgi:enamine deaminase RidA (YjgF/YER057c/UK114 family)